MTKIREEKKLKDLCKGQYTSRDNCGKGVSGKII